MTRHFAQHVIVRCWCALQLASCVFEHHSAHRSLAIYMVDCCWIGFDGPEFASLRYKFSGRSMEETWPEAHVHRNFRKVMAVLKAAIPKGRGSV